MTDLPATRGPAVVAISAPRAGHHSARGATPSPSARSATDDPAAGGARVGTGGALGVPASLDLRGARVEEAMESLDRYLDQASLAGAARVTIIHGHGTGAMRDAVRALASGHALVKDWRPGERGEGGDGATIVSF